MAFGKHQEVGVKSKNNDNRSRHVISNVEYVTSCKARYFQPLSLPAEKHDLKN